jgi:hypothetical protein
VGAEKVDEVGAQGAALQAAGGVGGQQAFGASLAARDWLPSESFRAMTAPRRAGSAWLLVGWTPMGGEGPQGGPDLEQVAREAPGVAIARRLGRVAAQGGLNARRSARMRLVVWLGGADRRAARGTG